VDLNMLNQDHWFAPAIMQNDMCMFLSKNKQAIRINEEGSSRAFLIYVLLNFFAEDRKKSQLISCAYQILIRVVDVVVGVAS